MLRYRDQGKMHESVKILIEYLEYFQKILERYFTIFPISFRNVRISQTEIDR